MTQPTTNLAITEQQLADIAAKIATYRQHAPTGFACCTAHPVADAGAALLAEIRRLKGQRKYLISQLAKRDAESGRGDEALREFLAAEQPAVEAPQQADPREPFRFVDDDGDYLHIGIPASPANGGPAVSFHTETEPVHVPVDRIDEVIATLRRLKSAQQ